MYQAHKTDRLIMLKTLHSIHSKIFQTLLKPLDGLPLLGLRLYLVPIFWMAGTQKLDHFEDTVAWFEYGLELPLPYLMAVLATWTEIFGAILLTLGLATRYISIPLFFTMIVAAVTVHLENGWYAIAQSSDSEVASRLERARDILAEYGNYDWLTEKGSFVILNNGIEFAVTYMAMLAVLIFYGGGRYISVDYWLAKFSAAKLNH